MNSTLSPHLRLLRLGHWVKNAFLLPGVAVALFVDRARLSADLWRDVPLGLLAAGLVASSNYVLNEILDAPSDLEHPTKRFRPVPSGLVSLPLAWLQWLLLMVAGVGLGLAISPRVAGVLAALWIMGLIYNVRPVRAKDLPFLDVLTESVNNPLRLLAGWYITGTTAVPTTSLLISYWMAGCYFMAVKRLAEYRMIGDPARAAAYRKSFAWYTEPRLLVAVIFYASFSMLFFGAFLMRYRMELVLSFPFVAWVMAAYLELVFQPDSAAQRPETLYRQPKLMLAIFCCAAAMGVLLFVDIPVLYTLFHPTVIR
jgi:decaprenyl-phosphate phosphoribosyltransferase